MSAPPARDPSSAEPLARRQVELGRLADESWDVVIVGGGIVGAGALLDAASRGLRAALVEQGDIAVGTSSRSSRLIHGGLRYLEQFRFGLVGEALTERRRMLRLAPHLVTLEPFLFPIYGLPFVTKAFYDVGLTLYDILGARHDGGWHRRLSVDGALELAPSLRRDGLRGGLIYHDGMEDDARFTLAVVRAALQSDASPVAVTRVRATGLRTDPAYGTLQALVVRDLTSGAEIAVQARAVVDATGAWAADPAHPFPNASLDMRPSRGAHLVVPRERIPGSVGLTIRVPGKVVFLVPWPDFWVIGTTDAPYDGSPDRPAADGWEIDELLATVNATLDVGLERSDVVGTYAGLRPLLAPAGSSTVRASREHRVSVESNGVVRVSGGKFTTYRVMARDVIDAVLGRAEAARRPSQTTEWRVAGAADRDELDRLTVDLAANAELVAVHPAAAARLVARHGTESTALVEFGEEWDLLRPIVAGRPFVEAEIAWAARHELALSVDDVLSRRMRLAEELSDRGEAIAPRVAAILARELGWGAARQALEVDTYLSTARREFAVAAPG